MWRYILFGLLLAILITSIILFIRSHQTNNNTQAPDINVPLTTTLPKDEKKFKGLALFDVDDTLSTGINNSEIVQFFIDSGWAVGICTANARYTMENIMNFPWMPQNLYDFIQKYKRITFNNVGGEVFLGKKNRGIANALFAKTPRGYDVFGFRKGYALEKTAHALGITNPKCMILFDDLTPFIKAVKVYNPDLITVCSGANCGGLLTLENAKKAIKGSNC